MTRDQRKKILRWATIFLTIGAFANSYRHGIAWATEHSPAGDEPFWAWAIAALPEVMVVIAVLLAMDRLSDPRVWVIGGSGVGWTLWANGAAASGGLSGMVVALSPAWSALLALWAMDHGPRGVAHEPVQVDHPEPVQERPTEPLTLVQKRLTEPVQPVAHEPLFAAHTEPLDRSTEPVQRPRVNRSKRLTGPGSTTSQSAGLTWATAQVDQGQAWPTVAQIMAEFPAMSRSTAKRVRAADPAGTAGTEDRPAGGE